MSYDRESQRDLIGCKIRPYRVGPEIHLAGKPLLGSRESLFMEFDRSLFLGVDFLVRSRDPPIESNHQLFREWESMLGFRVVDKH